MEDGTFGAVTNDWVAAIKCYFFMSRGSISKNEVSKNTKVGVFKSSYYTATLTYSAET